MSDNHHNLSENSDDFASTIKNLNIYQKILILILLFIYLMLKIIDKIIQYNFKKIIPKYIEIRVNHFLERAIDLDLELVEFNFEI